LNTKTIFLKNGVYLFVIEGSVKVGDTILEKRDGLGIQDIENFSMDALDDAEVLLMEVPMLG
jgi:quercetin 2,3-dioxygenase